MTVDAAVLGGPAEGASVEIRGVDWGAHRASLVFAMQVGCHWCEASAGFYRDLLASDSSGAFHPIAVLPQPAPLGKQFLADIGVPISEVHQADLSGLGVTGTPTLILVDSSGRVKKSWTGELDPSWRARVYQAVGLQARR